MQRAECREQFSVTVGTVFERSKIGLHKWVLAAHLMARQQEGHVVQAAPAHAGRHLQDRVVHDHAPARGDAPTPRLAPIGGEGKVVESDETFVGGKKKNVHKGKPEPKKHAVHALVERGGEVRAKHVADVTAKTLRERSSRRPAASHDCTPTKR